MSHMSDLATVVALGDRSADVLAALEKMGYSHEALGRYGDEPESPAFREYDPLADAPWNECGHCGLIDTTAVMHGREDDWTCQDCYRELCAEAEADLADRRAEWHWRAFG